MTKFVHVRPEGSDNRQGGFTIAFNHNEGSNEVSFAVARCNAKDNFCRATGRRIAEGRLNANHDVSVINTRAKKYETIVAKLIPEVESRIQTEYASALRDGKTKGTVKKPMFAKKTSSPARVLKRKIG